MSRTFTEGKEFKGIDFSDKNLNKGDYEDCTFVNCNFSNSGLSELKFVACEFVNCDFSLANITNTAFRDIKFKNCKLLGLHFENCKEFLFSVDFEGCQLNLSSFYKWSIKNTNFKDCSLQEVDFAEADLTNSTFINCDLSGAIFEKTILEKCDFRTSFNYSIDLEINKVNKAKFSISGIKGLLDKYNIVIE